MDTETLKANMTSGAHWLRLLYMLLFAALLYVAVFVIAVVIVLQFLFALLGGQPNQNLRKFGDSLAYYMYQALQFLTYSQDKKPFPFSDWPAPEAEPRRAAAPKNRQRRKPSTRTTRPKPKPKPKQQPVETPAKSDSESPES